MNTPQPDKYQILLHLRRLQQAQLHTRKKAATGDKLHLAPDRTSDLWRTEMDDGLLETEFRRTSS